MKAIPLLVVTNALALGLAIVLYVQQDELKTKVSSVRSTTDRGGVSGDTEALQQRIEALERQLREVARGRSAVPAAAAPSARVGAPSEEPAAAMPTADARAPAGDAEPVADEMPPAEMETFRRHVRRALELNGDEDRVRRVEDSLDELVSANRIAPLSPKQKTRIANTILGYREQMPQIWQRMRELPQGTSREERGQVMREEFENLRVEAQKALEEVVPAADAAVILEAQVRQPGMFGGGGSGRRVGGDGGFPGGR